jgi:hypothetical protein
MINASGGRAPDFLNQNKKDMQGASLIVVCCAAAALAGCGTISGNTVQLSVDVTARIKDVEGAHTRAINTYFDSEVDRAERFMTDTWTPLFLRNFLGTSGILSDLEERQTISDATVGLLAEAAALYLTDSTEATDMAGRVRAALEQTRGNDVAAIRGVVDDFVPDNRVEAATTHVAALLAVETPAQMILEFAEAANNEIDQQRRELIEPIEAARAQILTELRVAYQDIYAGQGVITGRLEAAAKRSAETARLVDALGGEGTAAAVNAKLTKVATGFNEAFTAVESAVSGVTVEGEQEPELEKVTAIFTGLVDGLKSAKDAISSEAPASEESPTSNNDGGDGGQ